MMQEAYHKHSQTLSKMFKIIGPKYLNSPKCVTMADASDNNHPAVNAESPDGKAIIDCSSISEVKDDVGTMGQAIDFKI
jgi:hypothetical protein